MSLSARLVQACLLTAAATVGSLGAPATDHVGLYDRDPNHLWNRVHRHLYGRIGPDDEPHGLDEVDPLLWRETRHLLTGPSHAQAIRLLDEFLETGGERPIADPVRRAVFQHDLWAVFDWLAGGTHVNPEARQALMPRLARVIRRTALARDQIERLPDTYAAAVASHAFAERFDPTKRDRPFLPRDMFTDGGPWVTIGGVEPVAAQHAGEISHSAFSVMWSVSGGEAFTVAYLTKLWSSPEPYVVDPHVADGERRVMVNPALPPVPDGTHLALVRRMLLVDRLGAIVPSTLTENIQLRVLFEREQRFFEFRMRRRQLFAGEAGGLQAVRPGDRAHLTFSSHGIDPFESHPDREQRGEILAGCRLCHQPGPAIRSILSVRRLLKPQPLLDSRHPRWSRWFTQANVAAEQKARRADWRLLQGFWQSNPW